ncbi:restriction endonuclease subunit S [Vibrio casei]|uniref:restriction endonuclease subunit S n=1 Tax=Vibrio casei TaxID=673372 RepID=UPI003F982E61
MEECNLGELATLYDSLHKTPKSYSEDGFPMVRVTDINRGFVTLQNVKYVDEETYLDFSKKHQPQVGDIIYARVGNTYGKSCYVDKAQTFCLGQNLVCITADKNKVDPFFLYSFLNSDDALGQMRGLVAGGAQPTISLKSIKEIKLNFPSLNEQILISDALKNYDNLIENNNRRIAILEDMAQSLYREWFVNFRYPNHEGKLDADGNPKLIDSPLGQIPEGWQVKRIKDMGSVNTGKTPSKKKEENYSSSDVPFIKTPDMHDGMFVIKTKEMLSTLGADSQKNKYIPSWAICVSCIGSAGVVALSSQISQTNQQINTLVPGFKKYTEFMYFKLKSLKKTIENHGATGATMTNLSKSKFEALEIVFPDESLLNEFHQLANPLFKKIQVLARKNENLKEQRDMLLPKLISGQIELKD